MRHFNKTVNSGDAQQKLYHISSSAKEITIYIQNQCSWMNNSGCTMCNYSCRDNIHASDVIAQYQTAIIEEILAQPSLNTHKAKLYINGSFFADNEIEPVIRKNFIKKLYLDCGITYITVESRAEYLSKQKILDLLDGIDVSLEIAIGIESTNDEILKYSINKGVSTNIYKKVVEDIKNIVKIKGYLLIKPLLLTENEAIKDIINSVKDLYSIGIRTISITPLAVQKNTLVEIALQERFYRPLWIWSIIEINSQIKNLKLLDCEIKISGFDYFPEPIALPFNCEHCSDKLWKKLKENPYLTWEDIPDKCSCLTQWQKEIQFTDSLTLKQRFDDFQDVYNKLIKRSNSICSTFRKEDKLLSDIAKNAPSIKTTLNKVGVQSLPIQLKTKIFENELNLNGNISVAVQLDEFHRGVHMSRLIEKVVEFTDIKHEDILEAFEKLSTNIILSQGSKASYIDFDGYFMLNKYTDITVKKYPVKFPLKISIININGNVSRDVEVEYQILNACPCTKVTNEELFNEQGSHTQRGKVIIQVNHFEGNLKDIIHFCLEQQHLGSLLKREDELNLVREIYNRPEFCEDICRKIADLLLKKFSSTFKSSVVTVITEESIHPHNAFAQKIINGSLS